MQKAISQLRTFFCAIFTLICFASAVQAVGVEVLLDPQHLFKYLKASEDQKTQIDHYGAMLRSVVSAYQTERAKRTCEATLWQGHIPHVKDMRTLRKSTRDSVDALIVALKTRANLDDKQKEFIDKILKGHDNILDYPIAEHPYYRVNNSPIFGDFSSKTNAYAITLPGMPDSENTWTYAQLLKTWTTRGYIPSTRAIDDLQQAPNITEQPDLQTRLLPSSERVHIARSPLLIAATLLVPDLGQAEFHLLKSNYPPDSVDVSTWDAFVEHNRMHDAIQVRLKLNTPYNKTYLDLNRWIIYLEDSEGVGYEPKSVTERAYYPIEAIRVSVPGQEVEVTDIFGDYISPIPGEKERFFLEAPHQVTYVGNEKLLQIYFPGHNFQGNPVITPNTKYLKLIIQSQETDFGRCELFWDLKRPKSKVRPPKD